MSWASVIAARLNGLFTHRRLERELDDEVRFHLEMQTEDNLRAGLNSSDARNAALRSFGGVEPMKEQYRDRRAFAAIEAIGQDVRYAVRTLRKSPGFTVSAVAVLALAIGANTAMFSVLHAVLLRRLPYPNPEQLVRIWTEVPSQNVREGRTAYWNIEQWRTQSRSFSDISFADGASATLVSADRAEKISVYRTSANRFSMLGIQPLHGRVFTAEEAEQRQRLALISHRFWQSRFGGSLDAIGASINLDGMPSRIIGILPADLEADEDVWEPYSMFFDWENVRRARGSGFWGVLGRLRPNVTLAQAQSEMNAIARRLDDEMPPAARNLGISLVPMSQQTTPAVRLALWMLTGAVFFVLLIAASNVASLSLARNAGREREIVVRAALGASRGRIFRQLLAESLTLAAVAGMLGLLVAEAGIRLILSVRPGNLARLDQVGLDPAVLAGSLALCLLTGILVGIAPAITMSRRSLRPSGEGGRSVAGGVATRRTRQALVVTEFALAIILLAAAGLLVRSLRSAESVDLGFRPERVLMVSVSATTKPAPQRSLLFEAALEQVGSLPGVESAAVIGDIFVGGNAERMITAESSASTVSERMRLQSDEASPTFFKAVGTPLLRGRFFTTADGRDPAAPVAIINDAMARRLWPGADPTGRRFKNGGPESPAPWFTVVGVVGDMRRQAIEKEPIPQMFEPLVQNPSRLAILLVRTATDDPLKMTTAVQTAIWRVDKSVSIYGVTTVEKKLGNLLAERRFQTTLLVGFSVAALLMAAIGIYGLIQYSIATRTHEIGIRIAIGAQSGTIFRMILTEGLKLSLIGVAIGLGGALWVGRAASSLLFRVSATDPLTFVTVSALLTAVAAAACYFPARRAMNLDPIIALRQD